MSDKPIYIPAAAGAEAFIIRVSPLYGDDDGQFEAEAERCLIVAWRLDHDEDGGGDPFAVPIIPGVLAADDHMVLCVLDDGTLWNTDEGKGIATLDDAKSRAVTNAHLRWSLTRELAEREKAKKHPAKS